MTMDTDRTEGRRVLLSVQLSAADSNTANVSEVTIYSLCQLLASVISVCV